MSLQDRGAAGGEVGEEQVIDQLRRFFLDLTDDFVDLDPDTPLGEYGLLNSLTVLRGLDVVARQLGVPIPTDRVKPKDLMSLRSMAALVARERGA